MALDNKRRQGRTGAAIRAAMACALFALCVPNTGRAAPPASVIRFGVAWYTEQWPKSRWPLDLDLMQRAQVDVVRIGEFAWSTLEPREGVYDFAWLDDAIAQAAARHIAVVIGTPTAAPPAWLTSKYPQALGVEEDGRREQHGGRQQFSFTDPLYRRFARDIAERLAERYGHDPRVIGWQIDNEIGPPSFDPSAQAAWHAWLARRYGTVAALNAAWTTAYWSQTYDSFDQVPLHSKDENPGLLLDYERFVSDTWNDYLQNQAQVVRAHAAPTQFVTTNLTHWTARFDPYEITRGLDLAAWDDYVPSGVYDWRANAVQHDLARGYKRADFWVMETQPAHVDWWPVNRALDPGQTREMAWQAIAHGADAVLYWQLRSDLKGQEQYHGTLLGADGEPNPVFGEIARAGTEFARAAPVLDGTTAAPAQVAMIDDLPSRWAIDFQRFHKDFDPIEEFDAFYRPIAERAQTVDVVSADAPLSRYRLVVAPALNVLTGDEAKRLAAYAEGGGDLVLGPRSGMKDRDNALQVERQPGPLVPLLGARVEQYYALDTPVTVQGDGVSGQASVWAERLQTLSPDAQVLMRYGPGNGWLVGHPAVVTRRVGRGSITYIGAWLDPGAMKGLLDALMRRDEVSMPLPGLPAEVEAGWREGGGRRVLVLINHGDGAASVPLASPMRDTLSGGAPETQVSLPAHDVAVMVAPS